MGSQSAFEALRKAAVEPHPLLKHRFFRVLYLVYFLLRVLLVLLPLHAAFYLRPAARPRKTWTLRRSLIVLVRRELSHLVAVLAIESLGRDLSEEPLPGDLKNSHFALLPSFPPSLLSTRLHAIALEVERTRPTWDRERKTLGPAPGWRYRPRRIPSTRPALKRTFSAAPKPPLCPPVPAFWFSNQRAVEEFRVPSRKGGERVALCLHGGAYAVGSAHEKDGTAKIARDLIKTGKVDCALAIDYRLSHTSPFPAALIDALTAYHYLLSTLHLCPSQIVLVGDSAGGHLALTLLHHLSLSPVHPPPRALLLFSPWTDLSFSHVLSAHPFSSATRNLHSDIIADLFPLYAAHLFTRGSRALLPLEDPYLSLTALSSGSEGGEEKEETEKVGWGGWLKDVCVVSGEAERLADEVATLVGRMRDGGLQVRWEEVEGAVHDFCIFETGWEPEQAHAFRVVDEWLGEVFSAASSPSTLSSSAIPSTLAQKPSASASPSADELNDVSSSSSDDEDAPDARAWADWSSDGDGDGDASSEGTRTPGTRSRSGSEVGVGA